MKVRIVLRLFVVLCVASLDAVIVERDSIKAVEEYLDDRETLIVLDIDNTLVEPSHVLASRQAYHAMVETFRETGIHKAEATDKALPVYNRYRQQAKMQLIEPHTARLIHLLQSRGRKVIALTSRQSSSAERTVEQLLSLRIDFTPLLEGVCHCQGLDEPFLCDRGITFCGANNKGQVLMNVLAFQSYRPERIIFVDDKLKNLRAVKALVEGLGYEFVGIRYSRLDEKVASFSFAPYKEQLLAGEL